MNRYSRQTALEGFGELSLSNLKKSTICLIGAGGVGSGALPILAGSGIGTIRISDADTVAVHNLHRQTLYSEHQIGEFKAECAAAFVKSRNGECKVEFYTERISHENAAFADRFFSGCTLCVDATDSFSSRFAVSDMCAKLDIPEIMASAEGFTSQNVFFYGDFRLDCLVPDLSARRASARGMPIFAAAAHQSGVWAAASAVEFLAGVREFETGRFLSFDFQNLKFFKCNLK